jgi:N-acetylglucosamine-6-sulfatase
MGVARGQRDRVRRLLIVGVVAALTIAAGCSSSTPSSKAAPPTTHVAKRTSGPNIVFVLTDDLSWNLVQYMPHVQAMERDGATFSKYFVTDSLCCPSRTSIMTGQFPHDSGVFSNTGADGGFSAFIAHDNQAKTFAVAMEKTGYRSALMGKYLNGYEPNFHGSAGRSYIPPGWDSWDVAGNGYNEFDYDLNENRDLVHYGNSAQAYLTSVLSRLASGFVSQSSDLSGTRRPFVLEVATFAPHEPYIYAPSDADRFDNVEAPRTAAFDAKDLIGNPRWLDLPPLTPQDIRQIDMAFRDRVRAVQAVDRMIGRLRAQLVAEGLAKNTYFVFSSDNGYHMGEHRLTPGKMTAFDTDIKVPLIVVGPGIKPGTKISALAENIDLAPTFERLAGLRPPSSVDGRSLVPLLEGHPPASWRNAVLVEHHGPDSDPEDPDYPAPNSGNPPSYEAMRLENALYVEYADGDREYYLTAFDPNELRNVYAELSPARKRTLHHQLAALERCHGTKSCNTADRLGVT